MQSLSCSVTTLPEALLLLAHDPGTGKLLIHNGGEYQKRRVFVDDPTELQREYLGFDTPSDLLNRALLAAGVLELLLCDRIVPLMRSPSAMRQPLFFRLAPDDAPLPTEYTRTLWNTLRPHLHADQLYPFMRLVRLIQTVPAFGDAYWVPHQKWYVSRELAHHGVFPLEADWRSVNVAPIPENTNIGDALIQELQTAVLVQPTILVSHRIRFLLGLLHVCDLIRPLFGVHYETADWRIRKSLALTVNPQTPIGNACAFVCRHKTVFAVP